MASHELRLKKSVAKALRAVPNREAKQLVARMQALKINPGHLGAKNWPARSGTEYAKAIIASSTKSMIAYWLCS